jgi:hypothetical protein
VVAGRPDEREAVADAALQDCACELHDARGRQLRRGVGVLVDEEVLVDEDAVWVDDGVVLVLRVGLVVAEGVLEGSGANHV